MEVWRITAEDVASSAGGWRTRFGQVYGLAPGQALKVVEPPFIPEREQFWDDTQQQAGGSKTRLAPNRDDFSLGLEWEGDVPRWTYAGGNRTLGYALQSACDVNAWEIDESVPRDLKFPGDWVAPHGATAGEKLASLGPIVSKKLGRPVRFEKRAMPREAVIVRGSYSYSPLWTRRAEDVIEFFDTIPPTRLTPVVNTTPTSVMWAALQHRLGRRVFDESTGPRPTVKWRDYLYTADTEALLRNLAKQTNLVFEREKRVMDVWVMVDDSQR
jgi:hypothetical protein